MEQIKTTKRFYKSFPSGVTMLNVAGHRYYYFNKTSNGYIYDGIFWNWLSDKDFPAKYYSFVFDRVTKETFKIS